MDELAPISVVIRPAEPGEAVSVGLAVGSEAFDLDLSPAEALRLAAGLIRNARISRFGEPAGISRDELLSDVPPSLERMLDMLLLQLFEARAALARDGDAPEWTGVRPGSA